MRSLVDRILADTEHAVGLAKRKRSLDELRKRARDAESPRSLTRALGRFGLIAEIKFKSPSVGAMAKANLKAALPAYQRCDAVSAISVLTQARYFGGSIEKLIDARQRSTKPILRKDFIIDEYQVWEARAFGADAILLMASLPTFQQDPGRLKGLFNLASSLKMECLCEIGMASDQDLQAVADRVPRGAGLWGVNARRFSSSRFRFWQRLGVAFRKDFITDIKRHREMWALVPDGKVAVAESGINTGDELIQLAGMGYSGALIGTALLKGPETVDQVLARFTPAVRQIRAQRRELEQQRQHPQTETLPASARA